MIWEAQVILIDMISKLTRKKLRDAAIKNGLGKYKIYNRKKYSVEELHSLIESVKCNGNFFDPFSKTTKNTENLWRNSIIRNLDIESCNIFFFEFEKNIPSCRGCCIKLSLFDFSYGGKNKLKGFKKYCKDCSDKEVYKRYKHSEVSIKKFIVSKKRWANSADGKKFYDKLGKDNSVKMRKYLKTPKGIEQIKNSSKKQSIILKEKIRNGTFTPNVTNSWTHWESNLIIDDKIIKFRSSWEASFFVCNQHLKYELLRIPYLNGDGNFKTYVGDFFDEKQNILYEIKPTSVFKKETFKINKVIEHCLKNSIKFVWINENNILNHIDKSKFSEYNMKQYDKMIEGIYGKNKNNVD